MGPEVRLRVPHLRLSPRRDNVIEVFYGDAYANYPLPRCDLFRNLPITHTGEFKPSPELVRAIERVARESGFSPAFAAALIAQESGFDPRQISWAKAIGLTQVTSLAEEELRARKAENVANWPKYPEIDTYPVFLLKAMITAGEINSGNEWRLHPERSIRGGLAYARILVDLWKNATPEDHRARLIMASYNSGYARVAGALERGGEDWLNSRELREAKAYVGRVSSFCDSFGGENDEDQT
jgi:soluble lytic murein transglycosylase-like protein